MKPRRAFPILVWLLSPVCGAAPEILDLPPFTVTGGTAEAFGIADVFVPAETAAEFGYADVSELARLIPGITAAPGPRGGPRNERRIFMRGFDSRQILLMVDGIPFYIPYDGEPGDFSRFHLWNAQTIEISKGISSVLFGPNAMGGAINIATSPPMEALEAEAFAGSGFDRTGDFQRWRGYARAGFIKGAIYGQAGAAYLDRNFWTLPDEFQPDGEPILDQNAPGNLQPAGRRLASAVKDRSSFARLGWIPRKETEVSLTIFHQNAEKQVPPYAGPPDPFERVNFFNWPQWDRTGIFLHSRMQPAPAHHLRIRLYYDNFTNRLERFDNWSYTTQQTPRSFRSEYDDLSIGGSGQWEWSPSADTTWIGVVHFRRDDHGERPNLLPGRRTSSYTFIDNTFSAGLEQRRRWGNGIRTVAGMSTDTRSPERAEDAQRDGEAFRLEDVQAWNATFSIEAPITEDITLNAGIARKSRLPAMFDRYSYRQGRSIPNPGLDEETAWNSQIGLRWSPGPLTLRSAFFYNTVDALMQDIVVGEDPDVPGRLVSQVRNSGGAEFLGIEISARWRGERFGGGLDYTYIERSLNQDAAYNLVGVPRHEATAYLTWRPIDGLELIPALHASDERLSNEFGVGDPVDGFVTVSLRALWEVAGNLRLEAAVENLFDELIQFDRGYPEPGRTFTIGLRWNR